MPTTTTNLNSKDSLPKQKDFGTIETGTGSEPEDKNNHAEEEAPPRLPTEWAELFSDAGDGELLMTVINDSKATLVWFFRR